MFRPVLSSPEFSRSPGPHRGNAGRTCDRPLSGLKHADPEKGPVPWSVEPAAIRDCGGEVRIDGCSNRIKGELARLPALHEDALPRPIVKISTPAPPATNLRAPITSWCCSSMALPGKIALDPPHKRKRAALGFVTGQKIQRKALHRSSWSNSNGKICSEDHAQSVP